MLNKASSLLFIISKVKAEISLHINGLLLIKTNNQIILNYDQSCFKKQGYLTYISRLYRVSPFYFFNYFIYFLFFKTYIFSYYFASKCMHNWKFLMIIIFKSGHVLLKPGFILIIEWFLKAVSHIPHFSSKEERKKSIKLIQKRNR